MKTIICKGHQELNGVKYSHGAELPSRLLTDALLDDWLDNKLAIEVDDTQRRSLYLLFSPFSGTRQSEPIQLDAELRRFTIF
jgi:hypothetical protein